MQTRFVLWIEPQPTCPIDINPRSQDDCMEALDTEFQWRLAARAASKRSNCKGPPGLPCAITPQGTWPPCAPSNHSTTIAILRTIFCPVADSASNNSLNVAL